MPPDASLYIHNASIGSLVFFFSCFLGFVLLPLLTIYGQAVAAFSHLFVLFSLFSSTHVAYPTADVCIALVSKSKTYSPQKSLRISVLCVCHFQGRHVLPCALLLVWSVGR